MTEQLDSATPRRVSVPQLRRALDPYGGRCPLCRAPLRVLDLDSVAEVVGPCEHRRELVQLAATAAAAGLLRPEDS